MKGVVGRVKTVPLTIQLPISICLNTGMLISSKDKSNGCFFGSSQLGMVTNSRHAKDAFYIGRSR